MAGNRHSAAVKKNDIASLLLLFVITSYKINFKFLKTE